MTVVRTLNKGAQLQSILGCKNIWSPGSYLRALVYPSRLGPGVKIIVARKKISHYIDNMNPGASGYIGYEINIKA